MKHFRRFFMNGLLVATSLAVLFIVLEVVARIVLLTSGDPDRFFRYASLRQFQKRRDLAAPYLKYQPHRYLGYTPTPNYATDKGNKHNALGYRDDEIAMPKPAGEYRIVCVGGSTTYTPLVGDYRYSYPNVLEQELHARGYGHVSVINAGVDGWTSHETLINFMLRVVELNPDMLIVHHGINDVFARVIWPPSAYQGDNSGYREPLVSHVTMPSIFEYSTVIRGLLIRRGLIQPHTALHSSFDRYRGDTFRAVEYDTQQHDGTYPAGVFEEAGLDDIFAANPPAYFRRNIEHLVVLAKHHGIQVVLSTIAYAQRPASNPEIRPLASSPEFLAECDAAHDILQEIANENAVNFFDFAEIFPKEEVLFRDEAHVTFEGVQIKGRLFADYLVENALVPSTGPGQQDLTSAP